jgi:hypothetical protein
VHSNAEKGPNGRVNMRSLERHIPTQFFPLNLSEILYFLFCIFSLLFITYDNNGREKKQIVVDEFHF